MSTRKTFLRLGRIVIVTLTLLGLSWLLLYFLVKTSYFRTWVESELSQRTGYDIQIGALAFSLPRQVRASEIAVVKSDETLLRAQELKIGLSPLDLFSGSLHSVQLEKPVVRLRLDGLIKPGEKSWPRLSIRTLNIQDGELVLQTREGKSLEFRSINLATKNLIVGQDAELEINAELPWLEAEGHFRLHGPPGAKEAEFQLRQRRKRDLSELLARKDEGEGVLKGRMLLKEKSDGIYAILVSANFQKFKMWADRINGQLETQIELDTDKREASFVTRVGILQFPSNIGRMAVPIPLGNVTGNFEGHYGLSEKRLEIASIKLESSFGSVEGKMAAFFGESTARIQGELNLHRLSIAALTPYFPARFRRLGPTGTLEAQVFLSGPWDSLRIKGVVRSEEVRLQSAKVSFARLTVEAPFEWDDSALTARGVRIRGKELKIGGEKSYQFEVGEVDLTGELEKKNRQPVKISGQARLSQGRFASPDQSKLGENFATSSHLTLIYHPLENRSVVHGQIAIERGELLWGMFFGDLRQENPSLDFSGTYLAENDEVHIDRLGLALRSVGSVVFKGNLRRLTESPLLEIEARTEDMSLGGVYDFFFRDTFKRTYPVIDQLRLGGRSKWVVRAAGSSEAWSAEGSVELEGAEIEARSNAWQIGPIRMVLPLKLRYPMAANTQPGGPPKTGSLEIRAARIGSTSIPPVKTALSFWNNSLNLLQPLRISIYGGTALLKDLAWKDIIKEPAGFSFSLDLQDVQLLPLTQALGWYRFGGTITGSISQIESIADSLRSRGGMELQVFGGRVIVKEMEIQNPFSWLRSFKLDARLEAIELERASETFEFGRISGILEGTIDDLVMTNGQPSQFRADIHTVDRSGASQWISVEALNKISVISSGNDAGFLYRGLAGFFENFRYSKLGFKAALKNDRLVLRGIESKEEKEFLVVGSLLPPTVNIISHTQEIGFSELLRRLKRVSEADKPNKSRPN